MNTKYLDVVLSFLQAIDRSGGDCSQIIQRPEIKVILDLCARNNIYFEYRKEEA